MLNISTDTHLIALAFSSLFLFSCTTNKPVVQATIDEKIIIVGGSRPIDKQYVTEEKKQCILHRVTWKKIELQNDHAWLRQSVPEIIDCEHYKEETHHNQA
ncbi:hypothetical protein FLL45_12140 [Aliikangiella marina]|uniref:Uncharacterized protein n=1 Tax=Aliikangiella marina TaxID=1712262 RepID=A0A545T8S0_9GAMM|nr:hypothetical protein [Aliikangiella marina]TQV73617.1 hypothetical protein FLL45_12140 [Aliikangiella marina]